MMLISCAPAELETAADTSAPDPGLPPIEYGINSTPYCSQDRLGAKVCDFKFNDHNGEPWRLYEHMGKVIVLDFSAAWCGPCKALKPIMDKLAVEYKDKAGFYYADIEEGGINTGSAAGIRGVPTVIIYKKGVEVDRKVGGVPESHMKEFLEKNI